MTRPAGRVQPSPFLGLGMRTHASDPTRRDELVLLLVFAAVFFITRGLYDIVPMLFAVGIAACSMAVAWKAMRLMRDRDVHLHRFQLKRAGRIERAGAVFIVLALLSGVVLAQGAAVKMISWRAGVLDDRVAVSRELVFNRPEAVPQSARDAAERALTWYRLASGLRSGGIGLAETPGNYLRMAWLLTVAGRYGEAESMLGALLARGGPDEMLLAERARVMMLDGRSRDAIELLESAARRHPTMREITRTLAALYAECGEFDAATRTLVRYLERKPEDAPMWQLLQRVQHSADAM